MKFIDKILFEAAAPRITKRTEDDRTIFSIGGDLAQISVDEVSCGYWEFEGDIDEDTYNELFPDDQYLKIEHLQVDSGYRGMGFAQALMKKVIAFAKQLGYKQIYLNASPILAENGLQLSALVAFYEKFGFKTFLDQGNNHLMILNL